MSYWSKITLYFIFQACISFLYGQDIYNIENSKKFARYLFISGEYELAGNEYERLHFLEPTNETFKLKLIESYRKAENYKKALSRFNDLYGDRKNYSLDVSEEYLKNLILSNSISKGREYLNSMHYFPKEKKYFYDITMYMYEGKYNAARNKLNQSSGLNSPVINEYKNVLAEEQTFNYKNPLVAAGFSSLIPGTGKVYAGYWKDGIISFLFVSAFTYQAYRGFKRKGVESIYGWINGGFAFGFYIGNIFGSAKAVNKKNALFSSQLKHTIEEIFHTMD